MGRLKMEKFINDDPFNIGATLSQFNINTLAIMHLSENYNIWKINHKKPIKMKKHRSKKWRNGRKK